MCRVKLPFFITLIFRQFSANLVVTFGELLSLAGFCWKNYLDLDVFMFPFKSTCSCFIWLSKVPPRLHRISGESIHLSYTGDIINIKSYHKYGDFNLRIIYENSFLRTKVHCIFCSLIANYWKLGWILIYFYFLFFRRFMQSGFATSATTAKAFLPSSLNRNCISCTASPVL